MNSLKQDIESLWDNRDNLDDLQAARKAVNTVLAQLDSGELRIAEPKDDGIWQVNEWAKKATLLSFRLNDNVEIPHGPGAQGIWYDKVASKFDGWTQETFKSAGLRAVPPAAVRRGAYIGRNVILMPSFVNIGAYVDDGTMVDTWATIGSCAQIGKNCHISGGVGIGGVMEPLQAAPVIIENNCFIGARSEVAEGVIVREGSVLSMGVYIGASTRIINRQTGETLYGEVPPYSVVVAGLSLIHI